MSKNTFLELLRAETTQELEKLIVKHGMGNTNDWIPYGGIESNFSVIGNQSSSAEKALVEKVTNMIDAVLMRKCYSLGINPKGPDAPKSLREALEKFFGVEDGDPRKMNKEQEVKFLDELCIMATTKGCKTWNDLNKDERQLNILAYDAGEGQSPKRLTLTILSLLAGNKADIPFTQGNFNQGGSGTLNYCGGGYCLVISKRHPDILNRFIDIDAEDDTLDYWGWTLIREEFRDGWKNPVYTYYAPGGAVPMFKSDTLPLKAEVLTGNEAKNYLGYDNSCTAALPYSKEVRFGTLFKMYDYKLQHKGPLVSHFKYDLGKCIYDTFLPINLLDCRKNKFNNDGIFRGLKKMLEDDMKEPMDKRLINHMFPIENTFKIDNQQVKMTLYGFNKRDNGKKDEKSLIDETQPILFTLGQQIQGGMDSRIISNAGLGVIKNSLLTIIEFPNITPQFKKDLFMTDRERLLDKAPKKLIVEKLKSFYKNDDILKEFCSERIATKTNEIDPNNSNVKNALEKWIDKNPHIKDMLGFGIVIPGGKGSEKSKLDHEHTKGNNGKSNVKIPRAKEVPIIREDPTFFIPLLQKINGSFTKEVLKNKSFKISFKTDAPQDFFDRIKKKGDIQVFINGKVTDKYSKTLVPGKLSLYFDRSISQKVGNDTVRVIIQCEEISMSIDYNIDLNIKNERQNKVQEANKQGNGYLGLPEWKEVTLENGIDGVTEETAVMLDISDDGEIFYINMDNKYLKQKLCELNSEGEIQFYKKIYIFAMLFNAISTKSFEVSKKSGFGENPFEDRIEEAVKYSTMAMARTFFLTEKLTEEMKKSIIA
ncbi:hypothetical protein [Clostridium beijerinckii]|uniref:Uncharacterized protein n=1 Tax=Clostridium beijerinckii TaxID=1520 RepID=A0A1S8S4A5_CLOBE|nr:hypothetical protein [Clostridium beijerinckii]NRY59532.1 hypothetical protein [Clostridium beijerinckii]OOM60287.1 hypothetical protein CLBCK_29860 [Clostridium beijerinckii]